MKIMVILFGTVFLMNSGMLYFYMCQEKTDILIDEFKDQRKENNR